jgi:Transposase and inactivated derivatives
MQKKNKLAEAIYTQRYVYNFHFHLIWSTKYRNQIFNTPALVQEMQDLLLQTAEKTIL